MPKQFYADAAFNGNQIINFRIENLAGSPTAGNAGRLTFNTTSGKLELDNGGSIVPVLVTSVAWADVTGKPTTFTPVAHTHVTGDVTGLDAQLTAKAPLASPTFTGTPAVPTATPGNDTTQIASTAFVTAAMVGAGTGDMLKATYDTVNNGIVNSARAAPWAGITGKPTTFTPVAHTHTASDVTDFTTAVNTQIIAYWDSIAGTDANVDTIREVLDMVLANASTIQAQISRYDADIGDGTLTAIPVTHSLNSLDVSVEVYEKATGATIGVDIVRTNVNVITINASPALALNSHRIVIKK